MHRKIVIDGLSNKNINAAIRELKAYKKWVLKKEEELRLRLASIGVTVASIQFARAIYIGTNDVSVRVDNSGSVAVIYAEGEAVAFIEFGAGSRYGYGHPTAGEHGMGPGTYPGKGHWDNEHGWWFGSGQHTYGNPPAMAMYQAVQAIQEQLTIIAKEVFSTP